MEAQQHEGKSLPYIVVHPNGYQEGVSYPMIILLHGYGANMADLAGLAPASFTRPGMCTHVPMPRCPFLSVPALWGMDGEPSASRGRRRRANTSKRCCWPSSTR